MGEKFVALRVAIVHMLTRKTLAPARLCSHFSANHRTKRRSTQHADANTLPVIINALPG